MNLPGTSAAFCSVRLSLRRLRQHGIDIPNPTIIAVGNAVVVDKLGEGLNKPPLPKVVASPKSGGAGFAPSKCHMCWNWN